MLFLEDQLAKAWAAQIRQNLNSVNYTYYLISDPIHYGYKKSIQFKIKSPFSPKQLVRPKSSNRLHQPSPLIAQCSAVSKSEGPATLVRCKSKTTQIRSSSMNNPTHGNTNIKNSGPNTFQYIQLRFLGFKPSHPSVIVNL